MSEKFDRSEDRPDSPGWLGPYGAGDRVVFGTDAGQLIVTINWANEFGAFGDVLNMPSPGQADTPEPVWVTRGAVHFISRADDEMVHRFEAAVAGRCTNPACPVHGEAAGATRPRDGESP